MLSPEHRTTLLTIARNAIRSVHEGRAPELDESAYDEELRRPAGCFVTLTHDGDLRGCIGSTRAVEPLVRAVVSSAVSAAFRDPRFYPLKPEELERVALEISVMGPIERVTNPEDILPGRDGLIITRGHNAGLLLPQVATEYGWDRETFLDQTCVKAGLSRGAWRDPATKIEKFAAEVFGEE